MAEKFRSGFGKRCVFVGRIGKVGTERALRHELDENVNDRGDDEREISRTRDGARRIFHFTARDQCYFDPDEGEHQ